MDEIKNTQEEAVQHFDNAASAGLAGYAEFLKKHEELIKKGVDRQVATIESIKALHATEASRYRWLADQAEAAGDLKRAAVLAREADNSAHLVATLSQQLSSSHQTLKAYLEASESALLAKTGGSKAAKVLLKKSGAIGNVASLASALSSGDDVEVTKAVANIVVGGIAGSAAGFFTSLVFPPGAPAAVAMASMLVSELLPKMISDSQWLTLTELGKDAVKEVSAIFGPYWQTFIRSFGGDLEDIAAAANDKFLQALNLIRRIDPLVLDLDGDGIETLGADAGVLFDFDGDGVKTGTGWIKGDDGFLVLDRNGNGRIDSGAELFGVDTVKRDGTKARNGFDALADLDSNGDGVFDANDEMFSHVRVWQDLNKDGIAQANEMKSLSEHGIRAIVLKSREANEDSNGNLISATGTFIRDDGTEGEVNGNQSLAADVDLESNPFYSEHTDPIELDDGARQLPNLQGSGMVRELREAAMLSPELRSLLEAYAASESHREQRDLLDRLISTWAATGEGYRPFEQRIDGLDRDGEDFRFAFSWETSGKQPTEAQKLFRDRLARLNVLESFNGQPFLEFTIESMSATSARVKIRLGANTTIRTVGIRNGVVVLTESDLPISNDVLTLLDASYRELLGSVQSGLLLQTRLKDYADVIDISLNGEIVVADFGRVVARLQEVAAHAPVKAILDGLDLQRSLDSLDRALIAGVMGDWLERLSPAELEHLNRERLGEGVANVDGTAGSSIRGGTLCDLLAGHDGNDSLIGANGDDWLFGGQGNDSLAGGDGNDVLVGGAGNDKLDGGAGSDVYVFGRDHGRDVIANFDTSSSRIDAIQYLDGIRPEDILVERDSSSLVLTIRGTSDRIVVQDFFSTNAYYHLDEVRFESGTTWNRTDVLGMLDASVRASPAPVPPTPAWPGEQDVHTLISAMASASSPGDMAGAVVPPLQQTPPNWASMAI